MKHLPVLLENRLVWGAGVPRGSRAEAQGSSSQSGLEDKCVFYVPGGTVTFWLAPYGVSFV